MRRVRDDEIVFYDHVADRINSLLGSHACSFNQSSLAERIGWNRSSLCNFVNRIDKGIAAHFIPRIAQALSVTTEHLICGSKLAPRRRNTWDPRFDETEIILEQFDALRRRNLYSLSLTSLLPPQTLPKNAMVTNFVHSLVNGANDVVAERWHEAIQRRRELLLSDCCENVDYLIPMDDLLRLPRRLGPYQSFSNNDVVHILQNMKSEWVRERGMRIIGLDESLVDPDVRLELSGNFVLSVFGREMQIRFHRDLRIDWDDTPSAVNASRECLIKLKRAAGFGVRERPSLQQVETLIDTLLRQVDTHDRSTSLSSRSHYDAA